MYYTKDKDGEYKVPRLAIRMDGTERIGEIRGVAKGQNVESHLEDILDKKLEDFKDREAYKRRINDSKMMTYIYTKYEHHKELTKEDLKFIYEVDRKIEGFGYQEDPRIEKIKRKDLAEIYECKEEEIGLNEDDFRKANDKGIRLKYYEDNLNFSNFKSAEVLLLPEIVNGNLDLSGLTSAESLKLPKKVKSLYLMNLKRAEGLELPEEVEDLYLSSLERVEDLKLPKKVVGLYLNGLKRAEGLKFPEEVQHLSLGGLNSAEGLKLPKKVVSLYLNSLKRTEGLELPEEIVGLDLSSLERAEGLKFPKTLELLYLNNLKSAEGLELPDGIDMDRVYLPEEIKIELLAKQSSKKRKKYFNWLKK